MTIFPTQGRPADEVARLLADAQHEDFTQDAGRLTIYSLQGSEDVQRVAQDAVARFFPYNAIFLPGMPSLQRFERELLHAWTGLLGGGDDARATLTSGGTESVFLALHGARERAGVRRPRVVVPYSQHATLSKACHYLGLDLVRVPLGPDHRADVAAMEAAITPDTIALCGSAPSWPHGLIDPIEELAALAAAHDLWMHVDACIGGCLAPFVVANGHPLPGWDLSVAGVSSVSADLHKYGYAPKPCSLVAFRTEELHAYGPVHVDDWPSGPYPTEGFVGSRPGSVIAAAWAVMQHLGIDGYRELAARTMRVKQRLVEGIDAVDGLTAWDTPLSILVFDSDRHDLKAVAAALFERGWVPLGTLEPELLHLTVDPVDDDWIDRYLRDLAEVCADVRPDAERTDLRYT